MDAYRLAIDALPGGTGLKLKVKSNLEVKFQICCGVAVASLSW